MANQTVILRIKLVRSPITSTKRQKATLESLGLRKMNQTIQHADTPAIRGMINKVRHLLSVEELEA
jgi:large subunit ribosomal protein L30